MIKAIKHNRLKRLHKGELIASNEHDTALVLWLTIFNAITSVNDLSMQGLTVKRSRPGYWLSVDGLGKFHFDIIGDQVVIIDFQSL